MRAANYNQNGTSHIIALLLVVVVAAVGFAGYKVMQAGKSIDTADTASQSAPVVTTPRSTADIKSKSDLNRATQTLNSASVDNDLDPSALSDDVSSLL